MTTNSRIKETRLSILKVLDDLQGPAGAARIMDHLRAFGIALQPRSIRFHLLELDKDGLTRLISKRLGRVITEDGRRELSHANVMQKVGFVAANVDNLSFQMSYDLTRQSGTVIVNTAIIRKRDMSQAMTEIRAAFQAGLCMGVQMAMIPGGQTLCNKRIPLTHSGITTVCSVTVNGILLKQGIPVHSIFGGLIETHNHKPVRFVELIQYSGSTLDPLEAFIHAGMTNVRGAIQNGAGIIGASFREIPSSAAKRIQSLLPHMNKQGLGGILAIGRPGQPLLDIPVSEGHCGVIVLGGLNPIAAVHEAGIRPEFHSLAQLQDVSELSNYREIYRQYMAALRWE